MAASELERAAAALRAAETVLVTAHAQPEGDALGSSLALALLLERMGKRVQLFNADPVPRNLRFLPQIARLLTHALPSGPVDAVVLCDVAEPERVSEGLESLPARIRIVFDHHLTTRAFGDILVRDADAPATCELILQLADALAVPLDAELATCLYAGIAVDTGNFRFSNAGTRAFAAAARLVAAGADAPAIAHELFEELPLSRLRLLACALGSLELDLEGRVASLTVDAAMLEACAAGTEDLDGLVNYPRALAGCAVALLLYPRSSGETRISLRTSVNAVDVESVARVFGGGGHQHAAGCTIAAPAPEARRRVVAEIERMLARVLPSAEQA